MKITQQDIQKASPSKAGRWPEESTLQPLHRKQRPRKGQGFPKVPEQVQTGTGPLESQAEPTPLAAPPVLLDRCSTGSIMTLHLVLTMPPGPAQGAPSGFTWYSREVKRGRGQGVIPQGFPERMHVVGSEE